MFSLKESVLSLIQKRNEELLPALAGATPGDNIYFWCANSACYASCSGNCKGGCQGTCTRSCKGERR